ncbi:protein ACCELERATED CELL DEATH 6-like [Triticum aestivum]|uniref:protein ACCELERATED CELL DEATH 6-like n=1 Tax=Triticum aestivum TaxID=4565 RepID=UPI001D009C80|nr:protein ACCELERATED CELL DEATH 6-like [Triticum aestivum]
MDQHACSGSWQELEFLLNRGIDRVQPSIMPSQAFLDLVMAYGSESCINKSASTQQVSDDIEAFLNLPSTLVSLLDGVTTDGGTVLHVVATYGDSDGFLRSVDIIHSRAKHLLFAQNKNGDTPLHCAARAGMFRMVSHLISLARDESTSVNRVKEFLEMENKLKETALHHAVHIGDNGIVKLLMEANSELASFPKSGTSPLYLAMLLEEDIIAETLYSASNMKLSYSGPNGQKELTKKILEWNSDLTAQTDESGSTPLHFAAAMVGQSLRGSVCCQVLEANSATLYQSDHNGLFPIHVAASVGERGTVIMFINRSPTSASLRDSMGRTFLHVAAEKKKVGIDNDGNTALHLAIQTGSLPMFCALLGNRQIRLNLSNKKRQTALDTSQYKIPSGFFDDQNSEARIHFALKVISARSGGCRRDHFEDNYNDQLKHYEKEELAKCCVPMYLFVQEFVLIIM